MKQLIIIAHGSRRASSNDEIAELAAKVEQQLPCRYDAISFAFLEMADPNIETAIDLAINHGALEINLLPYFLSAGNHVVQDLPQAVKTAETQFPQVSFNLLSYVGQSNAMVNLICDIAK